MCASDNSSDTHIIKKINEIRLAALGHENYFVDTSINYSGEKINCLAQISRIFLSNRHLFKLCTVNKCMMDVVADSSVLNSSFVHEAVDGIIIINSDGIIQYVNPSVEKLFNYQRSELIGESVNMLMPSPHRDKHDDYLNSYLLTGKKKVIGIGREVPCRKKNGTLFPAYLSVNEVIIGSEHRFFGVLHDLSDLNNAKLQIRDLSHRILQAQEKERDRISRELHDDIGSSLFLLKMLIQQAEAMQKSKPESEGNLEEIFTGALSTIGELIEKARTLSHELTPLGIRKVGLLPSLRKLTEKFEQNTGITVSCKLDNSLPKLDEMQEINIYRIIQEVFSNAAKYSQAKGIFLELGVEKHFLKLKISDDGIGFDITDYDKIHGIGIRLMKERSNLAMGNISINSKIGEGTEVKLEIPVE